MPYNPIGQYGLIGDMNSAALVSTDGSIDWCCFPRFDSPSVFASILDANGGGRFQIAPTSPSVSTHQEYLPNTNILSTGFKTASGDLLVIDFMPLGEGQADGPHEIHRIVRCTKGSVRVRCTFQPRLDYARANTVLKPIKGGVQATGNRQVLSLCSQVPLEILGEDATAEFTLYEGLDAFFVLAYGHGRPRRVETNRTLSKFDDTRAYWEVLASEMTYGGLWRDQVVRSFLLLHLMIYKPTAAIVAAPTASLPENIGGTRNWDYRYSWLRDSSFTMDALYRMGYTGEATRYVKWLLHQCKVTSGSTRIVYGISSNSSLKETALPHLEGYRGSSPVRIGNGASRHLQMDVFGEVILGIFSLYRSEGEITDEAWSLVANFAEVVCDNWHRKDRGVWEVRGEQQHFVFSKIMCWAALDRAGLMARALGRSGDRGRWRSVAAAIKAEVLELGWSAKKQAFVQRYGSDTLDASNLMIPLIGFLPTDDPRVRSTLNAIRGELADGPLVRRYRPEETDDGLDAQDEGAFTFLRREVAEVMSASNGYYNTVSLSAKRGVPDRGYLGAVHNDIDIQLFPFNPSRREGYLLFLGRVGSEKGTHLAIEVAQRLNRSLIIAGNVNEDDKHYFKTMVEPHIDGEQVQYFGEATREQTRQLYSEADCLLFPIQWEEPFGLVMIEAMACGTPVVAFGRGAVPEVLVHAETGFIVDNIDEMVDAARRTGEIDRARCRDHVERRFSSPRMVDDYFALYQRMLSDP